MLIGARPRKLKNFEAAAAVVQIVVTEDKVVVDLPVDIFQSFVKYGLEEHIRLKTYDKG